MMTFTIQEGLANVLLIAWLIGIPVYWLGELTRISLKNAFGIEDSHNVSLDLRAVDYLTIRCLFQSLIWPLVTLGSTWAILFFHLGLWVRNRRTTDGGDRSR